jgi:hypothetical protein
MPIIFTSLVSLFNMFNSSEYPKPLDESLFNTWLGQGRASRIPYAYLLIIWDELEGEYLPVFVEKRADDKSIITCVKETPVGATQN